MNRDIRFRALCLERNIICNVLNIDFEERRVRLSYNVINSTYKSIMDTYTFIKEFHEIILMQYTGLKDRNGAEIYEGDIIRILYSNWISKREMDPRSIDQYRNDIAEIKVVFYDFNGFYLSNYVDGYSESMSHGKHGFIEVIGNLYEHPELLEKK